MGYGHPGRGLALHLVYNPGGPSLPLEQGGLEAAYNRELADHHGFVFDRLYRLTNMPILRFGSTLVSKGQFADYMRLLKDNFCPGNLDQVMCRDLISVDWQGYLDDCDFNQQLGLPLGPPGSRQPGEPTSSRRHLSDLLREDFSGAAITVADHCYGCAAGQGSSCGAALTSPALPLPRAGEGGEWSWRPAGLASHSTRERAA